MKKCRDSGADEGSFREECFDFMQGATLKWFLRNKAHEAEGGTVPLDGRIGDDIAEAKRDVEKCGMENLQKGKSLNHCQGKAGNQQ